MHLCLLVVGLFHLVIRDATQRRVFDAGRHAQRLVGGADGTGNKLDAARVLGHVITCTLFRQLRCGLVDKLHLLHGVQVIVGHGDGGAVERVGFNDVSAGLQVGSVDLCNDVGPGDHKQVVVALELSVVALVAVTAEVSLLQLILLDRGAHRAIDEDDALLHKGLELRKGLAAAELVAPLLVGGYWRQVVTRRDWVKAIGDGVDLCAELVGETVR